MTQVTIIGWECEVCGHHWKSKDDLIPLRCAKCKSPYWNGKPSKNKIVIEFPITGNQEPNQHLACPNPAHSGFQRADGWWCSNCRRLYKK